MSMGRAVKSIDAEERIEDFESMARIFVDLSVNWVCSTHLLFGGVVSRRLVHLAEPFHLLPEKFRF